jgi:hypothetical protein
LIFTHYKWERECTERYFPPIKKKIIIIKKHIVMWLVRTLNDGLWLFNRKPQKLVTIWGGSPSIPYEDKMNKFSELKWGDEPIEVDLTKL